MERKVFEFSVKILKKKRKYENGNEILPNENINGNIIGFYGGTSVEKVNTVSA
jgi:hypothetical protein